MLNTATSIVQLNNLVVGVIVMCLKDRSMGFVSRSSQSLSLYYEKAIAITS